MAHAPQDRSATLPDGRRLGWVEYGDPDGTPVVYAHGFPGSRLDWLMFDSPVVAETGARVIAADRPGYGLSEPAPGRTLTHWPRDAAALADTLGLERFAVLGISGGGPFALACGATIPERVTAVGVVAGMGPADAPDVRRGSSWQLPGAPRFLRAPLLRLMSMGLKDPARLVARSKGSFAAVDAALLDEPEVAEAYVRMLTEALRQGPAGGAADAALYGRPWDFALEDVQAPVLLWHGGLDANVPADVARYVAGRLPTCRASFHDQEAHLSLPRNHLREILSELVAAQAP
jgi:pimeloyl-ACP methyl ester carboxylesterase